MIPVGLMFWLYPLEKEIYKGRGSGYTKFNIVNLLHKEPNLKNLIADIFSVPLSLDWYDIYIKNNSTFHDPSCIEEDLPTTIISFSEGDPRTYFSTLKETTDKTGGFSAPESGHPDYYMRSGESAFFRVTSRENYSINASIIFGGNCPLFIPSDDWKPEVRFNFDILMKPFWIAWLVRLLVLFIFWFFVLSASISIWSWFRGVSKH